MTAGALLGLRGLPRALLVVLPAALVGALLVLGGFAKTVGLGVGLILAVVLGIYSLTTPLIPLVVLAGLTQQGGWINAVLGNRLFSYSDVLVLLTLVGVFLGRRRTPPTRRTPEDLGLRLMILFVIEMGVSVVGAPDFRYGLIETQKFAGYALLLLLTQLVAINKRHIRLLLLAVVLGSAFSATVIVSDQYAGTRLGRIGEKRGSERLSGTHDNPAEGAQMMAAGCAIAMILLVRQRRLRWLTGGAVAAILVAIPATGTRAAVLVLGIAGVWLALKFRKHRRFGAVVLLAPIVAAVALAALPETVLERFMALRDPTQDSTAEVRLAMFEVGLEMLKENPLLGVGPGQFTKTWTTFQYRFISGNDRALPMHNSVLGFAVDDGLIGLALYLSILFVVFRGLRWARLHAADPEHRVLAEALEFGFATYFLCSLTGPGARSMFFWFLPAISLTLVRVARLDTLETWRARGLPIRPGNDPWQPSDRRGRRIGGGLLDQPSVPERGTQVTARVPFASDSTPTSAA